jgi:hypothetical protein
VRDSIYFTLDESARELWLEPRHLFALGYGGNGDDLRLSRLATAAGTAVGFAFG